MRGCERVCEGVCREERGEGGRTEGDEKSIRGEERKENGRMEGERGQNEKEERRERGHVCISCNITNSWQKSLACISASHWIPMAVLCYKSFVSIQSPASLLPVEKGKNHCNFGYPDS